MIAIFRQASKFAVVGVIATAVHITTAIAVNALAGVPPLPANVIAFVTACGVSYLGNRNWTFAVSTRHAVAVPRFLAVSLTCFGINQAIVYVIAVLMARPLWVAMIPVAVVVPALSFWLNRVWVFFAQRKAV